MIGNSLPGMHGHGPGGRRRRRARRRLHAPSRAGSRTASSSTRPTGRSKDATEHSGLGFVDETRSALFCDVDNDGDQDAAMGVGPGDHRSPSTKASARFTEFTFRCKAERVSRRPTRCDGRRPRSRDGDLDIYSCTRYQGKRQPEPRPGPLPRRQQRRAEHPVAQRGRPHLRGTRRPISASTRTTGNSATPPSGRTSTLDGDLDLYVANDFGKQQPLPRTPATSRPG